MSMFHALFLHGILKCQILIFLNFQIHKVYQSQKFKYITNEYPSSEIIFIDGSKLNSKIWCRYGTSESHFAGYLSIVK